LSGVAGVSVCGPKSDRDCVAVVSFTADAKRVSEIGLRAMENA